jgi:hypothetical protein
MPLEVFFNANGAYTLFWNMTSSHSGLLGGGGGGAGSAGGTLDSSLPYSSSNYTYTITLWNEAGYYTNAEFYVLVHDYVAPTINSPENIVIQEGETGYSISWNGSDLHPHTYEMYRNFELFASGLWNSSSDVFTISLDGLPYGNTIFSIVLIDENGNSVEDIVLTTAEDNVDPTISQPEDIIMVEGTTGLTISWNGTDLNPYYYSVTLDSSQYDSGNWISSLQEIVISLDGLEMGVHTFEIILEDLAGNTVMDVVLVTVNDETNPLLYGPPDIVMTVGDNESIVWTGSDLHPSSYEITRDGVSIESGSWNSNSDQFTVELNELSLGNYTFAITLSDTSGNFISDTVHVSVNPVPTTPTTDTTPTTPTPGDDTILTITIVVTIAGVVIVIVIVFVKKKS